MSIPTLKPVRFLCAISLFAAMACGDCQTMAIEPNKGALPLQERQLTSSDYNHILTNIGVWSPDGKWIYYDIRSDAPGAQFDGQRIERVNVDSGEVEVVYQVTQGASCGVVTASPVEDRVVFIHGPENPTEDWTYSFWHRRGVLQKIGAEESAENLDARDIVSPYTPGALRGGSHVHVFSGDGKWISFTYEDHVLATSDNPQAEQNQRNIGVAVLHEPVTVPPTHPRNHDGAAFSVLVTKTWDSPQPGSDEINRAHSDAWVGTNGYVRADGTRQTRALAFLGNVLDQQGNEVPEMFVVDVPDDVTIADSRPLSGTETTRPAPPKGAAQRRLTNTTERKYPGLGDVVRYWPRSSPDGSQIAFLMRDDAGQAQLWTISPTGEGMRQLTQNEFPVESAFTWRPDGRAIACVAGGQVCEVDATTGTTTPLTTEVANAGTPRPEAVVYSPDGSHIAFVREVKLPAGTFNQVFVVGTEIRE